MKKQNWEYQMELELQKIYGGEAICGYLRSPRTTGKTIDGKCALNDKKCKSCLPMDMNSCSVHYDYFRNYH